MSNYHVERLRAIDTQRKSVRASLAFVLGNWERKNLHAEIQSYTPENFRQAQADLDAVYFVRLYAEFEGLLKDHIVTNHPAAAADLSPKPKVDDVIAAVVKAEPISIEVPLRTRIDTVRDFRNSIAHSTRGTVVHVSFEDALSALNAFVARLHDPRL